MTGVPDATFCAEMKSLETHYLASDDPIVQSGFSGGAERWEAERRPILEGVTGDGDFLDVGCANGYLLECLVAWAGRDGVTLTPHGVDLGPRLIAAARSRLPEHAANLHPADAWHWVPPQRYDYVYSLTHLSPDHLLGPWLRRIAAWVRPGGRLIVGDYGSRSRRRPPRDMADLLLQHGFDPAGDSSGGTPVVTRFAWLEVDG